MVFQEFTVLLVADSGYEAVSALWRGYREFLTTAAVPVIFPRRGDTIQLGNLELEVLHPSDPVDRYTNENNASIVLRLTYGDVLFLFLSAMSRQNASWRCSQNPLTAPLNHWTWPLLKVAHHGSKTSCSSTFLSMVTPEVVVISVGKGNRYGLPDQETLDALTAIGAEIYRTDCHGTVVIWRGGSQYSITTEQNPQPRAPLKTPVGPPINRSEQHRRFRSFSKKVECPRVRFHNLMHGCPSLPFRAGAHLEIA